MESVEQGVLGNEGFKELIRDQAGYFAIAQALELGVSRQLVSHHLGAGRFERILRGIYRDTNYPPVVDGELVALWLWSECEGTMSHQTALVLHELSDALPPNTTLTVPLGSRALGRKAPAPGVEVVAGSLGAGERVWVGNVPVTSVSRTLSDCIAASVEPALVGQAIEEARARGLIGERRRIEHYIELGFVP